MKLEAEGLLFQRMEKSALMLRIRVDIFVAFLVLLLAVMEK